MGALRNAAGQCVEAAVEQKRRLRQSIREFGLANLPEILIAVVIAERRTRAYVGINCVVRLNKLAVIVIGQIEIVQAIAIGVHDVDNNWSLERLMVEQCDMTGQRDALIGPNDCGRGGA